MESLLDASELLKLDTIGVQDKKEIYQSLKGKLNIKYKDLQNKDSIRLLKQLVDAKLKEVKKLKRYNENRKEDEEGGQEGGEADSKGQ